MDLKESDIIDELINDDVATLQDKVAILLMFRKSRRDMVEANWKRELRECLPKHLEKKVDRIHKKRK